MASKSKTPYKDGLFPPAPRPLGPFDLPPRAKSMVSFAVAIDTLAEEIIEIVQGDIAEVPDQHPAGERFIGELRTMQLRCRFIRDRYRNS